MKRVNNILDQITDYNNIMYAYYKACKGKKVKRRKAIKKFNLNFDQNINTIISGLKTGDIKLGKYNVFTVYEPKERKIYAAEFPDRIIHHALINILEPYFEKKMIYQCFACRKEKGLDLAIKYVTKYCKLYPYYAKLDIHKYFDNIDHNILIKKLYDIIKDKDVMNILIKIIKSYSTSKDKGIPIGNLTSQYFANLYLSDMDHYIKNTLNIKGYCRYMDDFILFDDKDIIKEKIKLLMDYIKNELYLELNPILINTCNNGVPFLGYKITPFNKRLLIKTKKNFIKHFKKLEKLYSESKINKSKFIERLSPMINSLRRANCDGFIDKVVGNIII